jgi:hypothetical protein
MRQYFFCDLPQNLSISSQIPILQRLHPTIILSTDFSVPADHWDTFLMWVDERVARRRELHHQYTYHFYNRPPPLDPIVFTAPTRATGMSISPAVDALVAQFGGATIVSRPTKRIKEIRQELKESNARLRSVKNGYALADVVTGSREFYALEEPKIVSPTNPDTLSCKAEYVYPQKVIEKNTVGEIRNEFNLFRHFINEDDRIRNNSMMRDFNRKKRRRRYAMAQEYDDFRRYGREEAHRRAQRADAVSALKETRNEEWWPRFVMDCANQFKDLSPLSLMAKAMTFDEFTIPQIYRRAMTRGYNQEVVRAMIEHANEVAGLLSDGHLKVILDAEEKKVIRENGHSAA